MRAFVLAAAAVLIASPAMAVESHRTDFGAMPDGQKVEIVELKNSHGVTARIMTLGASVQALDVPDRDGKVEDVTLGYASLDDYIANPQYFGATVGRFANRIANGRFTLDGKTYQVPVNNGANSLHGGTRGFDKVVWQLVKTTDGDTASVVLQYVSPDGEMGYPGALTVTATFTLDENNLFGVVYTATTDKPTIVNLSNHTYWNLAGEGSPRGAMGLLLTIPADAYLPTDKGAIPTGEILDVTGTAFDFRKPAVIGARVRDADEQIVFGKGYDHNWIVSRDVVGTPRLMARVEDPVSGRVMEVLSDQPGIQFYSGNFLDATTIGKSGRLYRQGDAIALEPQKFPDTPNQPAFGSVRLNPGQTYSNTILFKFSTVK